MKKGLLIVISGPAGSGKGTVIAELRKMSEDFGYSVSATTRAPRPGEQHGINYYYISKEEFEKKIENGEMLEHTEYCGNYYGTLKSEAERITGAGKHIILEIEVDGAMQVARAIPEAVKIVLLPPDYKTLEDRLRGRNTDANIDERLARAKEELNFFEKYDYFVVNESGAAISCAEKIFKIVECELMRTSRNADFPEKFLGN